MNLAMELAGHSERVLVVMVPDEEYSESSAQVFAEHLAKEGTGLQLLVPPLGEALRLPLGFQ